MWCHRCSRGWAGSRDNSGRTHELWVHEKALWQTQSIYRLIFSGNYNIKITQSVQNQPYGLDNSENT
jgi:hypothetical protein